MRSAHEHHATGVLLAQCACGIVAIAFFYGALTTLRKGFKISESKTLDGGPAKVIALILCLVGIGIVGFAVFKLPDLAF